MFVKKFADLQTGINELKKVSYSVAQAVGDEDLQLNQTPQDVVRVLAENTLYPPTDNGVGWDLPRLHADCYGIKYVTTGGLTFGWEGVFEGEYYSLTGWQFFIKHPKGKPEGSTLRKSAQKLGWVEAAKEACF